MQELGFFFMNVNSNSEQERKKFFNFNSNVIYSGIKKTKKWSVNKTEKTFKSIHGIIVVHRIQQRSQSIINSKYINIEKSSILFCMAHFFCMKTDTQTIEFVEYSYIE